MPNGDSEPRNWVRLHIVLTAFHERYGRWPSHMKLGRKARDQIRQFLGPAHYARFVERLSPLPDDDAPKWLPIRASDGESCSLDYEQVGPASDPTPARVWLGIDPHVDAPHRVRDPGGDSLEWEIISSPRMLAEESRAGRDLLANAAKNGDWNRVLALLREHPKWINALRPGGKSGFTPLHQAAYNGAPASVIGALVALGAWRMLRTSEGELPVDIARRRGHTAVIAPLTPHTMATIEADELRAMEQYFQAVVRIRCEALLRDEEVRWPRLEPLQEMPMRGTWMAVPGMYGGFHFWLVRGAPDPLLMVASWSRVVDGSGQRHEISPNGVVLVAEGFV